MDSQELRDFYARMNEGELAKVASEAYDLTDVARPILQDEIAKRGLKIPLIMEPSSRPVIVVDRSNVDLTGVWGCRDIAEARRVQQFLNGAGVPCYWGENFQDSPEGLDFTAGVGLSVREEDIERVRGTLNKWPAAQGDDDIEVPDYEAVCPKCKSPDIVFHDIDENTAKFHWSCDACGLQWADDGVEATSPIG